jgi:formylglycine-generating enzyme required for sulfatase activity
VPVKRLTLLLALGILAPVVVQAAEQRIALVIGNSAYASGPLPNPASDAKLIDATLTGLGFHVILRTDANQATMKRAIQDFGASLDKAGSDAVGLFYYAGHGVQLNGRNYLIPVRANIEREGDLEIEAVSADWVIEEMRLARNGLNIVILDACRNNPFTRSMRSANRGLAVMDVPTTGILIAFSTAPGTVAEDGSGRNSPYTTALTKAMVELDEPLETLFKHVRVNVMDATQGKQVPWEYSSLIGADFYFKLHPKRVEPPEPVVVVPTPIKTDSGTSGSWLSSLLASSVSWLSSLFSSRTAPEATVKPTPVDLKPPIIVPEVHTISGASAVELFTTMGIQAQDIDAARAYPESTIRHLLESAPRHVTLGSTPKQVQEAFALCKQYVSNCKLSWYGEDEGLRKRTLPPFELDQHPVSVAAFRQFADGTHYLTHAEKVGYGIAAGANGVYEKVAGGSWRNAMKKHPADDDSPVVGVSFQDAAAYCQSKGSRLPTEDEWEYAARGPGRSVFPWGDDPGPVARTMGIPPHVMDGPAEGIGGRYKGLSGNVWQWVDTSLYAKVDPSDPTKVCACKVLKGGSWLESNPANKRAATRRYELPTTADEDSGFRCARTVPTWPDAEFWLSKLH